jgi:hypothetical protein
MKTNPATKYVTARAPKPMSFSILFRVYYRIVSRLILWLLGKLVILHMGSITTAVELTNLRSGGTYHAQVSISPPQLNLSDRLFAFAIPSG